MNEKSCIPDWLKTALFVIVGAVLVPVVAVAQVASYPSASAHSPIPTGTIIEASLLIPINTENVVVGQPVNATVMSDIKFKGKALLPKGSTIAGSIAEITGPSKNAPLMRGIVIVLDRALLRDGRELTVRVVMQALAAPPEPPSPAILNAESANIGTGPGPAGATGPIREEPIPSSDPGIRLTPAARSAESLGTRVLLNSRSRGAANMRALLGVEQLASGPATIISFWGGPLKLARGTQLILDCPNCFHS